MRLERAVIIPARDSSVLALESEPAHRLATAEIAEARETTDSWFLAENCRLVSVI
jgi:hypothetical protein